MTYGHLQADCLYTGISYGPNAWYPVWEDFTFLTLCTIGVVMASFQVEAPVSAPAYERIRDAAAAASTSSSGATSPRLYSPAPAALTSTTVAGQSPTPAGSQVRTRIMTALRRRCGHYVFLCFSSI